MNQAIHSEKMDYIIHVLKALPLLHFLKDDCEPFQSKTLNPKEIFKDIGQTAIVNFRRARHFLQYKRG